MHILDLIFSINGALVATTGMSIAGIGTALWRKATKRHNERETLERERHEERERREQKRNEELNNKLEELAMQIKRCTEGNVAIEHHMLYEQCNRIIDRNWVKTDELDDLRYIFENYKASGGNGTGELLYNRVRELKIRNE